MRSLIVNPHNLNHLPSQITTITPTQPVARCLKVPYKSLDKLAIKTINNHEITIAPVLTMDRTWRRIVAENINSNDPDGIAKMLIPSRQKLLKSGVDLNLLTHHNSRRIRDLAQVTNRYKQKLQKQGYIDQDQLFWEAINYQTQAPTPAQTLLIYGYFQPQLDQVKFINLVAGEGSIWVLPTGTEEIFAKNREAIAYLESKGWQVNYQENDDNFSLGEKLQNCFLGKGELPHKVQCHIYPNLEAEIRGVLSQVKQLIIDGVSASKIVLVTQDEKTYAPLLLDIAWEYQLPLRLFYKIPLRNIRLGYWIALLIEVIENNFPFESTAKLLHHPLARYLTYKQWLEARQKRPNNLAEWEELGLNLSLLKFPQSDTLPNWVDRIKQVLKFFDIRKNSSQWSREIVAFNQLETAWLELSKLDGDRLNRQEFFQDILEIITKLKVPMQPGKGGIEVHTPLSLQGASYPHVFLIGFQEGILPAAIENDPVLDFYESRRLSQFNITLETAIDIAQRNELCFYELLRIPTKSLTFSCAEQHHKKPLLPSPYSTRLGIEKTPPPLLNLASIEEARRYYLQQPDQLSDDVLVNDIIKNWQVEQRRESGESPDEYDGVIGIGVDYQNRMFSASQLTALGQCPFKWFSTYLLCLKEPSEAESEITGSLRGRLYHRCLEILLADIKNQTDLRRLDRKDINQALSQAEAALKAEENVDFDKFMGWEARRLEGLNMLELNLQAEDFLQSNAEIISRENYFDAEWYGLKVIARVDRIDRTPTGLLVLDYKTTSSLPLGIKDDSGKAKINIQMPLYQQAIAQNFNEVPEVDVKLYSLNKQRYLKAKVTDSGILEAFAEEVKQRLQQGNYPVAPDQKQQVCQYCEFDSVCRKGNRLSRQKSSK